MKKILCMLLISILIVCFASSAFAATWSVSWSGNYGTSSQSIKPGSTHKMMYFTVSDAYISRAYETIKIPHVYCQAHDGTIKVQVYRGGASRYVDLEGRTNTKYVKTSISDDYSVNEARYATGSMSTG